VSLPSTRDLNGWEAVILANQTVELMVIPAKGGDIYSLVDRETGVDVLAKTPAGLKAPNIPDAASVGEQSIEFIRNYEGGWQTLFPSAGDACTYRGEHIPFHGEAALKPWVWEPVEGARSLRLRVACETVPLTLERVLTLGEHSAELQVEDTVANNDVEPCSFVLGHHCAFGAPLVQPGAAVEVDAATVYTVDEYWDDSARIRTGQRGAWPFVLGRDGRQVDLREIGGPELASQDDLYLTALRSGSASIANPELGLKLRLEWDRRVFKWVVLWQLFGGETNGQLAGSYLLGIEPWTSRFCLEQAEAEGSAITVAGRSIFRTSMRVKLERY
jgi:galactose mutarotase-like enzyme